jgi:Tfp pilus assembly protein PilV
MPKVLSAILAVILGLLSATALKAQTLKFANESFVLAAKQADLQKIENDYLLNGETEANWSQKLVLTRFPTATDVNAFANNLCLAINTQRPGTGAAVSRFGADCYIAYSVASSVGNGQLNMVHRILVDPQGGIRSYVFAQRPSSSKSASDQEPVSRDQSIEALARLSPMIQLPH